MTSCFPGLRSRSGLLAAPPSAPRPPLPLRCPPPAPLQSATARRLEICLPADSSSLLPSSARQNLRLSFLNSVCTCHHSVLSGFVYAFAPRCGVAVSARLVCRKTRQAVSRVLSGMAGICLSGIFTVFFSFFCAGRPVLSSLGPAAVPRPCRIFFPSGCPVPSVIITAGLSCHCPVPWQWRRRGAVFRWWCGGAKEGERRD